MSGIDVFSFWLDLKCTSTLIVQKNHVYATDSYRSDTTQVAVTEEFLNSTSAHIRLFSALQW